jgi:predicted O-linked N-acetylglucosamine transferase (SPINDLY family)
MMETIAKNEVEYVKIAVKLGIELTWRDKVANQLMQSHPSLYDDKSCVTSLEAFYHRVVQEARLVTSHNSFD